METAPWHPLAPHAPVMLLAKAHFAGAAVGAGGGTVGGGDGGDALVRMTVTDLASVWVLESDASDLRQTLAQIWPSSTMQPGKLVALLQDSWLHRHKGELQTDPPLHAFDERAEELLVFLPVNTGKITLKWTFRARRLPLADGAALLRSQVIVPLIGLYQAERHAVAKLVGLVEDLEGRLREVGERLDKATVDPDILRRIRAKRKVFSRDDYLGVEALAKRATLAPADSLFADDGFGQLYSAVLARLVHHATHPDEPLSATQTDVHSSSLSLSLSQPDVAPFRARAPLLTSSPPRASNPRSSSPVHAPDSPPPVPLPLSMSVAPAPNAAARRPAPAPAPAAPLAPAPPPLSEDALIAERKRKLDEEMRRREEEALRKPKKKKELR